MRVVPRKRRQIRHRMVRDSDWHIDDMLKPSAIDSVTGSLLAASPVAGANWVCFARNLNCFCLFLFCCGRHQFPRSSTRQTGPEDSHASLIKVHSSAVPFRSWSLSGTVLRTSWYF